MAVQWIVIVALIASSLVAEGLGHTSLSWLIDATAVIWYLTMRTLRRGVELARAEEAQRTR